MLASSCVASTCASSLTPWPDRSVQLFKFHPDTAAEVDQFVSYATRNAKSSNLLSALTLVWDMQVKSIGGSRIGCDAGHHPMNAVEDRTHGNAARKACAYVAHTAN